MTATISTLEPFSSWLRSVIEEAFAPLADLTARHARKAAMDTDRRQARRRMRVGGGYCGTVELTGRYALNPHTGVRLYEDTEGRLHYLANLRPATDDVS
jgi:hypothetical protein